MHYEIVRNTTAAGNGRRAEKRAKSKSQRIAGKRIIFFLFKGEDDKALKIVTDPRKGWAD